jgi:hypothetical protein
MRHRPRLPKPFRILKDVRDGRITEIQPPISSEPYAQELYRILYGLVVEKVVQVNDDGKLTLDPVIPRLFRALGVGLTQLQQYDEAAVICHPRFEESRRTGAFPEVFVVMPFRQDLRAVYDDHIRVAVERAGLTCARADDLFGTESIIREIWSLISQAAVVIADCTGRNPNVFYEIGIAHTVGIPVILVTQSIEDVPFDLRHERVIVYAYTPPGVKALEHALGQALEFAGVHG